MGGGEGEAADAGGLGDEAAGDAPRGDVRDGDVAVEPAADDARWATADDGGHRLPFFVRGRDAHQSIGEVDAAGAGSIAGASRSPLSSPHSPDEAVRVVKSAAAVVPIVVAARLPRGAVAVG